MTLNWLQLWSITCDCMALVFNISLLPLTLFYSGPFIGKYKFLLFLYAFSAATYSLVQMIAVPTFYVTDVGFIFYGTLTLFGRTSAIITLYTFLWWYVQIIITLNLSFIYRCCVINYQNGLRWFHEKKGIALITLVSLSILIIATGIAMYGGFPREECDTIMGPDFHNFTGINIRDVGYTGAVVFRDGELQFRFLIVLGSYAVIIITSTAIIGYCVTKIVSALSGNSGLSQATHQAQRKLFILLLLQSLFPLIFTFIPPVTSYILTVMRISSANLTAHFGPMLSIAQAIDPLLTYYFIKDYRTVILNVFGCSRKSRAIEPSTLFEYTVHNDDS